MSNPLNDVKASLKTEFEAIITPTYANDVADVRVLVPSMDKVTKFPTIAFEIGTEKVSRMDASGNVFESEADLHVFGFVKGTSIDDLSDRAESLIQDLQRIIGPLTAKYVNSATSKWRVKTGPDSPIQFDRVLFEGDLKGYVYVTFNVHAYAIGTAFGA